MITNSITDPATLAPQRILITGGRAPVALELVRLLHRNGHLVYVAESMKYHLCRVSNAVVKSFYVPPPRQQPESYINALEQLITEQQIDLLIPTCEEIFYIAQGLDRLQQYCRVLSPDIEVLHRLHHKGLFIEQVAVNRQLIPLTFPVSHPSKDPRDYAVPDPQGHLFVRKPVYSRFAAKVLMPWESKSPFTLKMKTNTIEQTAITAELPDWIAQQYIEGEALCTYSVVHEGVIIAHATYTSRYRTSSTGASVYFEAIQHDDVYEWVSQFVQGIQVEGEYGSKLAFSGQISFDLIQEEGTGTLYPIECNPRVTSGIHLFEQQDLLAQALLDPVSIVQRGQVVMPKVGTARMLTLPMGVAGIKYNRSVQAWRVWWSSLQRATDVVYHHQDRKPLWEQFRLVVQAYRISREQQISITEALTYDIEWNGKESL